MAIYQSKLFLRQIKKIRPQEKESLDIAVKMILENPLLGEEKAGDLKGVLIYKFKLHNTLYLLAYRSNEFDLELIMFGRHENYYRDLKNYLKG